MENKIKIHLPLRSFSSSRKPKCIHKKVRWHFRKLNPATYNVKRKHNTGRKIIVPYVYINKLEHDTVDRLLPKIRL